MLEGSPPRLRRVALPAAILAVSSFIAPSALAADEDPAYFSERFGGHIERIVAGPDGTIYVAGRTLAPDLPASTSTPEVIQQQGLFFAAALEPDGRPRWTSYIAGDARDYYASVRGLAVAPDGSVWIAGMGEVQPAAALQPEWGGNQDGIVAKFAKDGTLVFATHLGGARYDWVQDLAITADGDAILSGSTSSVDFPPAPLDHEEPSWRIDAFVARLRGDGSGFAWARRFGGDGDTRFDGRGVAVDPLDGSIVVGMTGLPNQQRGPFATELSPPRGSRTGTRIRWNQDPFVIRLDPQGEQIQGAVLRGLDSRANATIPVVLGSDRSVLVGGALGVARTTPELFLSMTDAYIRGWNNWSGSIVARIGTDPSGRVVVLETLYPYGSPYTHIGVRDASLAEAEKPVERLLELGMLPDDIAIAPDGALLVAGTGEGVSFHASSDVAGPASGCIARVPLDGIRAPTHLRARVTGTRQVDLVWSRDGDRAEGFDIERFDAGSAPVVIGHVAGDVFRHRATGLTPGANHSLRVVAVFASGVRSASPVRQVTTSAEAPIEVVAARTADRSVDVRWADANGDAAVWEMQRRFGDGEWMATGYWEPIRGGRAIGYALYDPSAADRVADVAVPVTYRVRATGPYVRGPTRWVESAPLAPSASMLLTQREGRMGRAEGAEFEFVVSGTIAPAAGAPPLAFDPSIDDLHVIYGDAAAPGEYVMLHGYPGWTSANGVHRWSAAGALTPWNDASEVLLDFEREEFVVKFRSASAVAPMTTDSLALGLRFGDHSGGDVRVWTGSTGVAPEVSFPVQAKPARSTRR